MQIRFLPIRTRIVLLLSFTLVGALATYFWVASQLIISDKTSYIYDYSFSQVRLVATEFEAHPDSIPSLENLAHGFQVKILDLKSNQLVLEHAADKNYSFPSLQDLEPFIHTLQDKSMRAGAKEFEVANKSYLVAFEFLQGGKYLILSLVSKSFAFQAADILFFRSLIVAACILLISIGLTLILLKSLVNRISDLATATEQVSQGVFKTLDSTPSGFRDEITLLGSAFNVMVVKIQELLTKTADQARMEKELETAQLVQSKFFPAEYHQFKSLEIAGKSVTASECGGDYWQYAEIGPYVVAILGDVIGHGASAAIVTALIHGAWMRTARELKVTAQKSPDRLDPEKDILAPLILEVDLAIGSTSGELSTFPCLIYLIHPKENTLFYFNAGHPAPYLYESKNQILKSLMSAPSQPLGSKQPPILTFGKTEFHASDVLLSVTDGYFDARLSDKKELKKKDVRLQLEKLYQERALSASASDLNQEAVQIAMDFFGPDVKNRLDDITVMTLTHRD